MDSVTVLVTGAGAPGIAGTIESLRNNPDRATVRIVGVDSNPRAVGRLMCDEFREVPAACEIGFVDALFDVIEETKPDVLLPQVTAEIPELARHALRAARNHRCHFALCRGAVHVLDKERLGLASRSVRCMPWTRAVTTWDDLEAAVSALDKGNRRAIVKPPRSSGARGYREIVHPTWLRERFFSRKAGPMITLDELRASVGEEFGTLLVQEHLPGAEYSVDVLTEGPGVEPIAIVPRRRDSIRSGITFEAVVEEHAAIESITRALINVLDIAGLFGFQFRLDVHGAPKLLECNPRVQGTMAASTHAGANVIWGAVKLALGYALPAMKPQWGTVYQRYWGGLSEGPAT